MHHLLAQNSIFCENSINTDVLSVYCTQNQYGNATHYVGTQRNHETKQQIHWISSIRCKSEIYAGNNITKPRKDQGESRWCVVVNAKAQIIPSEPIKLVVAHVFVRLQQFKYIYCAEYERVRDDEAKKKYTIIPLYSYKASYHSILWPIAKIYRTIKNKQIASHSGKLLKWLNYRNSCQELGVCVFLSWNFHAMQIVSLGSN